MRSLIVAGITFSFFPVMAFGVGVLDECSVGFAELGPSALCLQCHDGSRAWKADGPTAHPVDVNYVEVTSSKPESYVVNQTVNLWEGLIVCGTCHTRESAERYHRAVPGKALCLACHIL